MGTIIRITGDGVFIESGLKMEPRSSDLFSTTMCNHLPHTEYTNEVDGNVALKQNALKLSITRTTSFELNGLGQFRSIAIFSFVFLFLFRQKLIPFAEILLGTLLQ